MNLTRQMLESTRRGGQRQERHDDRRRRGSEKRETNNENKRRNDEKYDHDSENWRQILQKRTFLNLL